MRVNNLVMNNRMLSYC